MSRVIRVTFVVALDPNVAFWYIHIDIISVLLREKASCFALSEKHTFNHCVARLVWITNQYDLAFARVSQYFYCEAVKHHQVVFEVKSGFH